MIEKTNSQGANSQAKLGYQILLNPKTLESIKNYHKKLKSNIGIVGESLKAVLENKDINNLTTAEFIEAILQTKKPKYFAEKNKWGEYWNQDEAKILAEISLKADVQAYHNGKLYDNETFYQGGHDVSLIFVNGILAKEDSYDYNDIANNKMLIEDQFKQVLRSRLELLLDSSEGIVTIPRIGCGVFANNLNVPEDFLEQFILNNELPDNFLDQFILNNDLPDDFIKELKQKFHLLQDNKSATEFKRNPHLRANFIAAFKGNTDLRDNFIAEFKGNTHLRDNFLAQHSKDNFETVQNFILKQFIAKCFEEVLEEILSTKTFPNIELVQIEQQIRTNTDDIIYHKGVPLEHPKKHDFKGEYYIEKTFQNTKFRKVFGNVGGMMRPEEYGQNPGEKEKFQNLKICKAVAGDPFSLPGNGVYKEPQAYSDEEMVGIRTNITTVFLKDIASGHQNQIEIESELNKAGISDIIDRQRENIKNCYSLPQGMSFSKNIIEKYNLKMLAHDNNIMISCKDQTYTLKCYTIIEDYEQQIAKEHNDYQLKFNALFQLFHQFLEFFNIDNPLTRKNNKIEALLSEKNNKIEELLSEKDEQIEESLSEKDEQIEESLSEKNEIDQRQLQDQNNITGNQWQEKIEDCKKNRIEIS